MRTTTKGYNPLFLGTNYAIDYPTLTGEVKNHALNEGEIFDFTHFSLVMNKETKFAVYSIAIIDKSKFRRIKRKNSWHYDPRIGKDNQVGNELYAQNVWDRGHLTRRYDVCWGAQAKQASHDTFCWANIALQHHDFNTGVWNDLENWLLAYVKDGRKMIVTTGPIHRDSDIEYCGVHRPSGCKIKVPYGFWKSITFVDQNLNLMTLAFIIRQYNKAGGNLDSRLKPLKTYQVPLTTVTKETGIEFDRKQYDTNPLFFFTNPIMTAREIQMPEAYLIEEKSDMIVDRNL
ncbi:DNA/RNA non-specific endonuclease [Paenibacillus popilliae]|uniref:DNA/RNA endonuclease G n=1 Tax=Paenibacillus popilliae ATCC 14706 TaxID=1212764 RepID=M9LBP5_PAEPP|nr:DNA/RNA non-specific endonuclease [Paenibacillus popilliae]GAC43327.1 DNA/RNA endonuclease G [Paenibacillus popilliae ATCC 14706]